MKVYNYLSKSKRRWCKGSFKRERFFGLLPASYCLVGAIDEFYPSHADRERAFGEIGKVLSKRIGDRNFIGPVTFNDEQNTTYQDVLEVVKEAGI